MQYGIVVDDIYNFDETGFAMGVVATAKVISRREEIGKPRLGQPGNQDHYAGLELGLLRNAQGSPVMNSYCTSSSFRATHALLSCGILLSQR
jgi:hypothetical protein